MGKWLKPKPIKAPKAMVVKNIEWVNSKAPKNKIEKQLAAKPKNLKEVKMVSKPMGKPKPMEQTPTGMANSTKGSPYLPPTRPNRKPKL